MYTEQRFTKTPLLGEERPKVLSIQLSFIAEAPAHILREMLPQFVLGRQTGKIFTLGFILYRIKFEKLFAQWGHRSFYVYCRQEGGVKPANSENWRIAFYAKYKALGFSLDEMQDLQGRGHHLRTLRRIYQVCHTREEALAVLADPNARGNLKKRVTRLGYEPIKRGHVGPLVFAATEYDLVQSVLDTLNRQYGMNERRGVLATVLLCKVLLQVPIEKRYTELKRLCLYYGLHADFANAVMGEEKWREIKNEQ